MEHPVPTAATIKELYARAYFCAYPGCKETLYREDELTGDWVLNSRACHIRARREGGPRWDTQQSQVENRSERNLIAMCTTHAAQIDVPDLEGTYTTQVLEDWKRKQQDEHNQLRHGWLLTSAMADEITELSGQHSVKIVNSRLSLGGEGGQGLGAGGGGGGAIGPKARGGTGGQGGRVVDGDGNPIAPEAIDDFLRPVLPYLTEFSSPFPGSGGGGGGSIGEGETGGDGGDGGEMVLETLHLEPGDTIHMNIGEGGRDGTVYPTGTSGGDTTVTVLGSDGEIKRTLTAKGGASGVSKQVGRVDRVPLSEEAGRLNISTLLAADHLEIRENLAFVLGGAWARMRVPVLPSNAIWPVLCIGDWKGQFSKPIEPLSVSLTNPTGNVEAAINLAMPTEPSFNHIWVAYLQSPVDQVGVWTVRVNYVGVELAALPIEVEVEST